MSWMDDLAGAVNAAAPAVEDLVRVGSITGLTASAPRSVQVSIEGSPPISVKGWTASFDLSFSALGIALIGRTVLIVMPDGQPHISDIVIVS